MSSKVERLFRNEGRVIVLAVVGLVLVALAGLVRWGYF
jgi:hypothetical protein